MVLDGDIGEILQCDRCGVVHHYDDGGKQIQIEVWNELWADRGKGYRIPDEVNFWYSDYCPKCAKEMTPAVYAMRDVCELKYMVSRLGVVINERIKADQNNRPSQGSAC